MVKYKQMKSLLTLKNMESFKSLLVISKIPYLIGNKYVMNINYLLVKNKLSNKENTYI